jgi:ribosomal-protein-alanine N-acetyltransferase
MAPNAGEDILKIRDLVPADLPLIKTYWTSMTPADIERLCLDPDRIPARLDHIEALLQLPASPHSARTSEFLIWELNGAAIGMSSLRNIRYAEYAEAHLHVIEPRLRRSGYGQRFFIRSLEEYLRRFHLALIVCEPSSTNPGPNRLLQKLGFTVARTYRTIPSDVNREHEVNRYEITPAQVQAAAASLVD